MQKVLFLPVLLLPCLLPLFALATSAFTPRPMIRRSGLAIGVLHLNEASVATRFPEAKSWKRKHVNKQKMYGWLTWLHRRWEGVEVGKLEQSIVEKMVPAVSAYAKLKTKRGADQAEEVLYRLIAENEAENPVALLSKTAFHGAMDGHAQIGQPERAQAILQRMIELSKSDRSLDHLQPDAFSLTIMATAWAKSRRPEAADKAEGFLRYMENHQMNVTTIAYNVLISAIATGNGTDKALRAQKIVHKMKLRAAQGFDCQPDLYTYQTWMAACSRSRKNLNTTIEIFEYLDKAAKGGSDDLRPNAHCYASLIHSLAASKRPGKAQKAYHLLQEMRRRYEVLHQKSCRPNVVVFTSVISACVVDDQQMGDDDKTTVFQIAQLVFEELLYSEYGPPNFLTYAAFFRVCLTCLDDIKYRDDVLRRVFQLCVKDGGLGQRAFQIFEEASSPELREEVIGSMEWGDLPKSWRRNVVGERYQL